MGRTGKEDMNDRVPQGTLPHREAVIDTPMHVSLHRLYQALALCSHTHADRIRAGEWKDTAELMAANHTYGHTGKKWHTALFSC